MSNTLAIKNRLKSIRSTKKITHAMKLVAISELQKIRGAFLKNREYDKTLEEIVHRIIAVTKHQDHPLFKVKKDSRPLTIVVTSDLGLAGAYNQNIYKLVKQTEDAEHFYYWIGHKGYESFKKQGFNILNNEINSKGLSYRDLEKIMQDIVQMYYRDEVTSISLVYTEYVNAITFVPKKIKFLPFETEGIQEEIKAKEIIFQPNLNEVIAHLLPQYINGTFYNRFLESKVSEYASRRMAMENATDNADELIDVLQLQFNKARQAAITADLADMAVHTSDIGETYDVKMTYTTSFDELLNRKHIRVMTAYPLDEVQKQALKEALNQMLNTNTILEVTVDEGLIQGINIDIDGRIIEGSVKTALEGLKKHLNVGDVKNPSSQED